LIADAQAVRINCDARLSPLLARAFPTLDVIADQKFTSDGPVEWELDAQTRQTDGMDVVIMMGSLPRLYRPTRGSFPSRLAPLLAPDRERKEQWAARLDALDTNRKVGICWRSIMMNPKRAAKFPPLEAWQGLANVPETTFVSLQANITDAERAFFTETFGAAFVEWEDADLLDDMDDMSALVRALDGVVTAKTYIAWFSAGLGVPTWRINTKRREDDWTFLGQSEFPWFPAMRVLCTESDGGPDSVFQTIASDLTSL